MGPCRVCLETSDSMQNVFTNLPQSDTSLTVAFMLSEVVNQEILNNDGLPEAVCSTCLERIIIAYELKIQYQKSEAVLKQCVDSLSHKIGNMFPKDSINDDDTILVVLPESKLLDGHKNKTEISDIQNHSIKKVKDNLVGILLKHNDQECDSEFNLLQCEVSNQLVDKENCDNKIKKLAHECTMCDQSFISKGELKLHMRTHPIGTKHICKICSRTYRKVSILKRHYITHTEQKKYKCPHCNRMFHHANALNTHMIYHGEKKFVCSLCDGKFFFGHLLIEHLQKQHMIFNEEKKLDNDSVKEFEEDAKNFDCTMSNKVFSNNEELREHRKYHPDGTKHLCKICGKTYLELSNLKRHIVVHTGKKTYLCTVCGKSFYYKNVLKAHMVYHNDKKHECRFCNKKFHMRNMLQEHIRICHSDERYKFMCEVCGKLCSSTRLLTIHKESHNKTSCPICGKNYKNTRCYKEHLKTHSGNTVQKKSFICDYCGENRSLKISLQLHILSKHLNERRYICCTCNKGFFSKGSLNEHIAVHNRKKMEKCNVCGRLLVNKKALLLHSRLHTGERPYGCDICGERFLSSSRRQAHQKSKHGERTEHCQYCPSKFYLRSDLNKHTLVHMKEPKKHKKDNTLST